MPLLGLEKFSPVLSSLTEEIIRLNELVPKILDMKTEIFNTEDTVRQMKLELSNVIKKYISAVTGMEKTSKVLRRESLTTQDIATLRCNMTTGIRDSQDLTWRCTVARGLRDESFIPSESRFRRSAWSDNGDSGFTRFDSWRSTAARALRDDHFIPSESRFRRSAWSKSYEHRDNKST